MQNLFYAVCCAYLSSLLKLWVRSIGERGEFQPRSPEPGQGPGWGKGPEIALTECFAWHLPVSACPKKYLSRGYYRPVVIVLPCTEQAPFDSFCRKSSCSRGGRAWSTWGTRGSFRAPHQRALIIYIHCTSCRTFNNIYSYFSSLMITAIIVAMMIKTTNVTINNSYFKAAPYIRHFAFLLI